MFKLTITILVVLSIAHSIQANEDLFDKQHELKFVLADKESSPKVPEVNDSASEPDVNHLNQKLEKLIADNKEHEIFRTSNIEKPHIKHHLKWITNQTIFPISFEKLIYIDDEYDWYRMSDKVFVSKLDPFSTSYYYNSGQMDYKTKLYLLGYDFKSHEQLSSYEPKKVNVKPENTLKENKESQQQRDIFTVAYLSNHAIRVDEDDSKINVTCFADFKIPQNNDEEFNDNVIFEMKNSAVFKIGFRTDKEVNKNSDQQLNIFADYLLDPSFYQISYNFNKLGNERAKMKSYFNYFQNNPLNYFYYKPQSQPQSQQVSPVQYQQQPQPQPQQPQYLQQQQFQQQYQQQQQLQQQPQMQKQQQFIVQPFQYQQPQAIYMQTQQHQQPLLQQQFAYTQIPTQQTETRFNPMNQITSKMNSNNMRFRNQRRFVRSRRSVDSGTKSESTILVNNLNMNSKSFIDVRLSMGPITMYKPVHIKEQVSCSLNLLNKDSVNIDYHSTIYNDLKKYKEKSDDAEFSGELIDFKYKDHQPRLNGDYLQNYYYNNIHFETPEYPSKMHTTSTSASPVSAPPAATAATAHSTMSSKPNSAESDSIELYIDALEKLNTHHSTRSNMLFLIDSTTEPLANRLVPSTGSSSQLNFSSSLLLFSFLIGFLTIF